MSQEEITRFGQDLKENPELLSTIQDECNDAETLVKVAQERGYDFTAEEFTAHVEKNVANSDGKLEEEQLEKVAGGAIASGIVDASFIFNGII